MNLVVYTNETYEEEEALYDLDSGQVILMGDYYHDKISYVIKGYLIAKDIDSDKVDRVWVGKDHEMFDQLKFYDGSEDYS